MKKVFVCGGMGFTKNDNIKYQAISLGKTLAEKNCIYLQGGSDKGLMGLTLNEFLKYSKNVEFFISDKNFNADASILRDLVGNQYFNAIKISNEAERLKMISYCDIIIVLPGGTGTLEELLYCNETFRAGEHKADIYLVNIDGFYNGLIHQLETNIFGGFSTYASLNFEIINDIKYINFD